VNTNKTSDVNYTSTVDSEEAESLRRSRQQAEDGDVRWLADDTQEDIPADHHGWPSSALDEDTDIPEAK
jgi:hypothetical protein